jgi:hypothetical protein
MESPSPLPSPLSPSSPSSSLTPPPDSASSQWLSLHHIFCLYPRERLLVPLLEWTSRHVELLGCSFEPPSPAPAEQPRHEPPYNDRTAAGLARRLVEWCFLPYRRGERTGLRRLCRQGKMLCRRRSKTGTTKF